MADYPDKTSAFTMIHLGIMMMARKHSKKRESWGKAARYALVEWAAETDNRAYLEAYIIRMVRAEYTERHELHELAMDRLHDIMCEEFPEADDGIRYCSA